MLRQFLGMTKFPTGENSDSQNFIAQRKQNYVKPIKRFGTGALD